mgnify:CR=1 FL=1
MHPLVLLREKNIPSRMAWDEKKMSDSFCCHSVAPFSYVGETRPILGRRALLGDYKMRRYFISSFGVREHALLLKHFSCKNQRLIIEVCIVKAVYDLIGHSALQDIHEALLSHRDCAMRGQCLHEPVYCEERGDLSVS